MGKKIKHDPPITVYRVFHDSRYISEMTANYETDLSYIGDRDHGKTVSAKESATLTTFRSYEAAIDCMIKNIKKQIDLENKNIERSKELLKRYEEKKAAFFPPK